MVPISLQYHPQHSRLSRGTGDQRQVLVTHTHIGRAVRTAGGHSSFVCTTIKGGPGGCLFRAGCWARCEEGACGCCHLPPACCRAPPSCLFNPPFLPLPSTSLSFPPSTSSHPHSGHGSLHLGPSRWFDRASTSPVHLEASQHCLQLASRIDTQSRLPARFVVFCLPVTPALQHRICLRPCTVLPIHPRSNLLPSRRQCHICLSFQRILLSAPLFTSAPRLRASMLISFV